MGKKHPQKLDYYGETNRILEEIRIVLPGTGVLLGFQFNAIFAQGFNTLPEIFQKLHIVSLLFLLLTMILLIAPVAFDRVAEGTREIRQFFQFAHDMVRIALVSLALGLSIDLFVVLHVVIKSDVIASTIAAVIFIVCITLWFGYTLYMKKQNT